MDEECYVTKDASKDCKQKMRVTPLKVGTPFLFHLDFVNATQEELGYLLYALRPTIAFRHKLGLGKPLGLGQVQIDVLGLAFIDRASCYDPENLFGPKYRSFESRIPVESWKGLSASMLHRYREESRAARSTPGPIHPFPSISDLAQQVREGISPAIRNALEAVGDPALVKETVTYPVRWRQDSEGEHFRWFVENDKRRTPEAGQALRAIKPGSGPKPLRRL